MFELRIIELMIISKCEKGIGLQILFNNSDYFLIEKYKTVKIFLTKKKEYGLLELRKKDSKNG